jgi:hypothetical protein
MYWLRARGRINSADLRESARARQKREALGSLTKRLPFYVNVNRTSLDHLLLGRNADIDKNVE